MTETQPPSSVGFNLGENSVIYVKRLEKTKHVEEFFAPVLEYYSPLKDPQPTYIISNLFSFKKTQNLTVREQCFKKFTIYDFSKPSLIEFIYSFISPI